MNPVDDFIYKFHKLFPTCSITVDFDEEDVVFYHDAPVDMSLSDQCALQHISRELSKRGVAHWFIQTETIK